MAVFDKNPWTELVKRVRFLPSRGKTEEQRAAKRARKDRLARRRHYKKGHGRQ